MILLLMCLMFSGCILNKTTTTTYKKYNSLLESYTRPSKVQNNNIYAVNSGRIVDTDHVINDTKQQIEVKDTVISTVIDSVVKSDKDVVRNNAAGNSSAITTDPIGSTSASAVITNPVNSSTVTTNPIDSTSASAVQYKLMDYDKETKCCKLTPVNASEYNVRAIKDGIAYVADQEYPQVDGKMLVIKHDNGEISIYSGLSNIVVKTQEKVVMNQALGQLKSGILHFEMRQKGVSVDCRERLKKVRWI